MTGREGKNIHSNSIRDYALACEIGLGMTFREVQLELKKKGLPLSVAEGFDTSTTISEIVSTERIRTPQNLNFSPNVNQQSRQRGNTKDMNFGIDSIISYVSEIFTPERGDVIFTGTPEGVSPVTSGNGLTAKLEGLITLTCYVR